MGGLLQAMKYETYGEYDPLHTALAESAFLTVWSGLGRWHEDLVLVGGLVPKYLCVNITTTRGLPRPATLDVDLGIALAADSGQYGNLLWELNGQGFKPNQDHPSRFEKTIGNFTVPVDFLVEKSPLIRGTAQVEDITAGIMPGVDRALATARRIPVSGVDLHGAEQKNLTARVCEVGPFLALKLRAFYDRQQPKDAFDILYTILHYDGGTDVAIAAFAEEVRLANPACADALRSLREHFATETSPGPVKASHFVLGNAASGESEDMRFRRTTIRQDMVDAASRLLRAVGA
jgi:predicted nucleotidyltransferase